MGCKPWRTCSGQRAMKNNIAAGVYDQRVSRYGGSNSVLQLCGWWRRFHGWNDVFKYETGKFEGLKTSIGQVVVVVDEQEVSCENSLSES